MGNGKEKWVELCEKYWSLEEEKVNEAKFQNEIVSYFEKKLEWKIVDRDNNVPVKIGRETKYADLVLKGNKNDFKIVIEFKAPKENIDDEDVKQLWGYMRILGVTYGFLIGNVIKAIYDDDGKQKYSEEIEYDKNKDIDNKNGIEFIKILGNSKCLNESLLKYMKKNANKEFIPTKKENEREEKNRKIYTYFRKKGYSVRQKGTWKAPFFAEDNKETKISWILTPMAKGYKFKWETNDNKSLLIEKLQNIEDWCNGKNVEYSPGKGKKPNAKIIIYKLNDLDDALEILKGTQHHFGWPKIN